MFYQAGRIVGDTSPLNQAPKVYFCDDEVLFAAVNAVLASDSTGFINRGTFEEWSREGLMKRVEVHLQERRERLEEITSEVYRRKRYFSLTRFRGYKIKWLPLMRLWACRQKHYYSGQLIQQPRWQGVSHLMWYYMEKFLLWTGCILPFCVCQAGDPTRHWGKM